MMTSCGLVLVACLAGGIGGVPQGTPPAPSSRRAIEVIDRGETEEVVDPIERSREVARRARLEGGILGGEEWAGDLVVLAPDGAPLGGATVALVRELGGGGRPELLQAVHTGEDGRADLSMLDLTDRVVLWAEGFPATVLEGELLREFRRLAGRGAMVVVFEPSEVLTGRITVDGEPPGEGVEWSLSLAGRDEVRPSLNWSRRQALEDLGLPGPTARLRVDAEGNFVADAFWWPLSEEYRPEVVRLGWDAEDLFLASALEAYPDSLSSLRRVRSRRPGVPVVARLVRGGWVSGRVDGGELGSLDRPMCIRFGLPGSRAKRESVDVAEDGSFRFALPLPFFDLDLDLVEGLGGPERVQRFSFEAPEESAGRAWELGTLSFDFQDARLLLIRDEGGLPIAGAGVSFADPRFEQELPFLPGKQEPWDSQVAAGLSSANGRLLVRVPEEGERMWVAHPDYERLPVQDLSSRDGSVIVTLKRAAVLHLVTQLPEEFPASRLLVQIEADRPVLQLHHGDRRTTAEAARQRASSTVAARLLDARSDQVWSFTTDFRRARGVEESGREGARDLELGHIFPGVPFHLRAFDPLGAVFLDVDVPGFAPGERRDFPVDVPGPFFHVEGRVVFADGEPAGQVDLSFGSEVPVYVGTTDRDGRFSIEGLSTLEGLMLIEKSYRWMACFVAGEDGCGRVPSAVLLEEGFRFRGTGPTVIRLPPTNPLEVLPLDEEGQPSSARWKMDLYAEPSGVFLGGFDPHRPGSPAIVWGVRALTRPPGVPVQLVLTHAGKTIRRSVAPAERRIEVRVPSLGSLEVTWKGIGGESQPWRVELCPAEGGESIFRDTYSLPTQTLDELLPGRFLVRAAIRPEGGKLAHLVSEPIEVTVVANAVVRVEVR